MTETNQSDDPQANTGAEADKPSLFIAPQIRPEQMPELKAEGIRGIICNRPDGEEAGQPSFADIEKAAREHGIEARYVPVHHDRAEADLPERFARAVAELPAPVLAYCRSGARSNALAQAAQVG